MIKLKNIHYSYGTRTILDDVNATLSQGSFHALLGPNGCGKTTMLRCIAGLLKPASGVVEISGTPTSRYSTQQLAQKIAFVQQHPHSDFEFTAFETVLMGRNPWQRRLQNESQQDLDIAEECMKQTNTWHLRNQMPSQLSGGELQRVMIARALTQQTPILLLDEPTSNLDIAHQFEIMELLRQVNANDNKTILIVVHDLNLAIRYCPEALLMNQGNILFQGPTPEALTKENIKKVFCVDSEINGDRLFLYK